MLARTMDSRSPRPYACGILIHGSSKIAGSLEEIELDAELVEDEAGAGFERVAAYQARTPYDEAHPKALAVYCSDGRFTNAVEELLQRLGHGRIDTLTIPGGAALLHLWSANLVEAETVRKSASFLIEGHKLEEVVLIAHAGCGYYRARFRSLAPDEMVERQVLDLGKAANWLRQHHPRVRVSTFLARPDSGQIRFENCDFGPRAQ